MRTLRIRLRTLMIAVAVVAVLIGVSMWATRMRRLREEYTRKAVEYSREERMWIRAISKADAAAEKFREQATGGVIPELAENLLLVAEKQDEHAAYCGRMAKYHARLKQKYERAASRPWISVPPDPPEPPRPPPMW